MMDYQEAIDVLTNEIGCVDLDSNNRGYIDVSEQKFMDACNTAISAMNELQEYKENEKRNLPRTNRLMDECTYRHENGNCLKIGGFCTSVPTSHCQRYKELHNEYTEYKKLGTLEEVLEAVEKQKAKKPEKKRNVFAHGVESHSYHCPNCKFRFINKDDTGFYSGMKTKFCPDCGQEIDWSEEE